MGVCVNWFLSSPSFITPRPIRGAVTKMKIIVQIRILKNSKKEKRRERREEKRRDEIDEEYKSC